MSFFGFALSYLLTLLLGVVIGAFLIYLKLSKELSISDQPTASPPLPRPEPPQIVEVEVPGPNGWFQETASLKNGRRLGLLKTKTEIFYAFKEAGEGPEIAVHLSAKDAIFYDEADVRNMDNTGTMRYAAWVARTRGTVMGWSLEYFSDDLIGQARPQLLARISSKL